MTNSFGRRRQTAGTGLGSTLLQRACWPDAIADQPAASSRWIGLGGTILTACLIVTSLLVTISPYFVKQISSPSLTVIDIRPPASPLETHFQEQEAPRPVEKKQTPFNPVSLARIEPTIVPISTITVPIPAVTPRPADPASHETETARPEPHRLPPAPQVVGNGPDTWEGRVLAALNK